MQLNVFSTDNHKTGFRLQYMEVFNWGTFDDKIWRIAPHGETSLLTGANGSGKTTLVDALLTLMVPVKQFRFYNQSSGSEKKGDRTEDSYVLGGYSTIQADDNASPKTLYLREKKEEAYSILLANFANEADQQVTIIQVRYFSGADMKKIFAIAHKSLSIEADFKPFDLNGAWRKRIDQQYNKTNRKTVEWFDAASRYAQRLVEVLGMQSLQALQLFNQTVGIKVLGNLDDFIRTHMLEPRNMEEQFQELKKHLGTLTDAQRNIEKAETQISLLRPLQQHYAAYKDKFEQSRLAKEELDTATIWSSYTKYQLLTEGLGEEVKTLQRLKQQVADAKHDLQQLLEEERQTRNLIEQNKAGQRLQQLTNDLAQQQQQLRQAEAALQQFTEWCKAVHLGEDIPADEATYQRIKKEADRTQKRLNTEIRNNEEDRYEAQSNLSRYSGEKNTIEKELNSLLQHRNNIPSHLIQLRRELCAELRLDASDLPFAGELMQVKPEEAAWQPALEKLLHGFSLRLLVPDQHYKKVNRYVNNTNLRTRLVYNLVKDVALVLNPEEDTVYEKLEFHPDNPLSEWVAQQVIQQFDYTCVADEKKLDRHNKAITVNGLIKSHARHEKDDRPERGDVSRYVMGWNNELKKEALQTRLSRVSHDHNLAAEARERADNKSKRLQAQSIAVNRILEHSDFRSLNTAIVQRAIAKTEDEIATLKDSSDQLKVLTGQLENIQARAQQTEQQRDDLLKQEGLLEQQQQTMLQQQQQLLPLIDQLVEEDKDKLLQFQQRHHERLQTISLGNVDQLSQSIKESVRLSLETLQEAADKEGREVDRYIHRIKNPAQDILQKFTDWASDVHQLTDDREHAQEYEDWLNKLETDNLPKYKKDFERYLHETMIYKMGELNEELENWERKIKQTLSILNGSLGGINFNRLPDTYIQLGMRYVPDTTIKEFRHKLLHSLPQAANWQQNTFEEKAAHFRNNVQPLIDLLDSSEGYRDRVLDVRNWFEFWTDERYRDSNELKKTYRQMGQLSGGEKAQLTYTILCSAIAYQFGITREGHNARSLRFIAVDESFSNQDEEKATYLMELCKQLHLQLLVVTPSDKIQVVERFIAHVHLVQRVNNRHSILYNMTKKELADKREALQPG